MLMTHERMLAPTTILQLLGGLAINDRNSFCTLDVESPLAKDFSKCSFDIILLLFPAFFQDLGHHDRGTTSFNVLIMVDLISATRLLLLLLPSAPPRRAKIASEGTIDVGIL